MISVKITTERIDHNKEITSVKTSLEVGSVVSFLGTVRSENDRVKSLVYEHYEEMAKSTIERMGEEAIKRFGVESISVVHRFGQIPAGEDVVLVTVSSKHRAEGFEACSWLIKKIKEKVPIWKETSKAKS